MNFITDGQCDCSNYFEEWRLQGITQIYLQINETKGGKYSKGKILKKVNYTHKKSVPFTRWHNYIWTSVIYTICYCILEPEWFFK